jgi:hypothetical protein
MAAERYLSVGWSIGKAEQQGAAIVEKQWRILEIAKFLPKGRYV